MQVQQGRHTANASYLSKVAVIHSAFGLDNVLDSTFTANCFLPLKNSGGAHCSRTTLVSLTRGKTLARVRGIALHRTHRDSSWNHYTQFNRVVKTT
jgi:hypothetical protein